MNSLPVKTNVPNLITAQSSAPAKEASSGSQPFSAALAKQTNASNDSKNESKSVKPNKAATDETPPPETAAGALTQLNGDPTLALLQLDPAQFADKPVNGALPDPALLPQAMLASLQPRNLTTAGGNAPARAEDAVSGLTTSAPVTDAAATSLAPALPTSSAPTLPASGATHAATPFANLLPVSEQALPPDTSPVADIKKTLEGAITVLNDTAGMKSDIGATTAPLPNISASNVAPANAAPLTQGTPAPASLNIQTPITQPNWGDEFNQKVTWVISQKNQSAELHLNPPQLGPVDVVIKVNGDQASAVFTSPHAAVRDAIEQALPKLREMMADNGIMLGNANVNDQAQNRQNDFAETRQNNGGNVRNATSANELPAENTITRVSTISRHNGIVDTFA